MPGNPVLQQQLLDTKDQLAACLEKLRCFDHHKYMIRAHADRDKAGELLVWLTSSTCRGSPLLELESAQGANLYEQAEINLRFEEFHMDLYAPLSRHRRACLISWEEQSSCA
ncbi:hypothetical protein NDU88_004873 [Pleurodeles waltl]|uniref:Uncharacterized protein n=1 Tax=Pleurodeles waltl TaxID=8319 RepID=A0AAV7NKU8_PLEWA|nr:hypothetical protein NDU88_004873 [Pleurodeles waltl]